MIQRACEHEQVRNERAMTQCRPNEPLDRRDEGGFTKFLWACNFGQADRMEALLAAGCNAAAVTDLGKTGLILAAACGHAALLPWLLERGALDREARDIDGFTAFLWACHDGQAESAEALRAAGCDTSAVTNEGWTGLMLAAKSGCIALLPLLLECGASLKARDPHGVTAFLSACYAGKLACAEALLAAGSDAAAANCRGTTALLYAVMKGWELPRLLEFGVPLEARDDETVGVPVGLRHRADGEPGGAAGRGLRRCSRERTSAEWTDDGRVKGSRQVAAAAAGVRRAARGTGR